jgi:hypothetical protein
MFIEAFGKENLVDGMKKKRSPNRTFGQMQPAHGRAVCIVSFFKWNQT